MKKAFFLIGLSEFSAKFFSWLTLALMPFIVSSENYGKITLYYYIIITLIPVLLFGQDRLVLKNNPEQEVVKSLFLTVLLWIFLCVIMSYYGYFLAALASLLLTLNKIYLTYLRAKDAFPIYVFNRFFYSFLRLVLVLGISYLFFDINNYIIAESVSAFVASIGLLNTLKYRYILKINVINRLKHGFPLMLHGVSLFGIALVDRLILERFASLEVVGNYSFVYMFASGLTFLYSVISLVQEKKIYQSNNEFVLFENIKRTILYMFIIGLLGSFISFFIYRLIFSYNFVTDYIYHEKELIILLLAYLVVPLYLVSNYYLIQKNKAYYLLLASFLSFSINIVVNLICIPVYGLLGAAWATLISNIFLVTLIIMLCFKVQRGGFHECH